ncbi:LysR family transcriptional regulator [Vibrio sp. SCSIO 43135]|uniref:LysR family transcriptional regulator n=1 Tax=Vibrio paucivorans TaxID=2829489 RepID=A0A9X3CGY5_9VIBR|nr:MULTISPECIES: LysR family transcriptional regulator [Vibrio]MCW8335672.1 LysR family transcriptional regulator [Vibrio paucivorans]USD43138.1 LysR family transcriptional regulator [Vibrio sp. SCSIO 43135]
MKNTIDLNLYRFLDLLYEQKSQAKVCHTLGISRATFNRHLADCRELFANELFLATKGIYQPTLFTTQLIAIVKEPLEQLEQAQQISQSFEGDNANIDYIFHVANPLSSLLTVPLVQGLTSENVQPNISIVDWSLEGVEFPRSGSLAVGISGYPNELNERVVERKLGSLQMYVYLSEEVAEAHFESVSLEDLERFDMVRVSMGSLDDSAYYERLRRRIGLELKQKLTVASVHSALDCVRENQYAFVCPHIAESSIPKGVVKKPITLGKEPMQYEIGIQFHRACYQHPVINKIENIITQRLREIAEK